MKKQVVTYFEDFDPSYHNILAGYALGQKWHNNITGDEFYHKLNGVWEKIVTETELNSVISNIPSSGISEELAIAYSIAL